MRTTLLLATLLLGAPAPATSPAASDPAAEFRKSVEAGPLFKLARSRLGRPVRTTSSNKEGMQLHQAFRDGSTLVTQQSAPETVSSVLTLAKGIPRRVVVEALAPLTKELQIDLAKPARPNPDGGAAADHLVYRSEDDGLNARIELDVSGDVVRAVRVVVAL